MSLGHGDLKTFPPATLRACRPSGAFLGMSKQGACTGLLRVEGACRARVPWGPPAGLKDSFPRKTCPLSGDVGVCVCRLGPLVGSGRLWSTWFESS